MRVKDARKILRDQEAQNLIDMEQVTSRITGQRRTKRYHLHRRNR